jgi:hypothetical protein
MNSMLNRSCSLSLYGVQICYDDCNRTVDGADNAIR